MDQVTWPAKALILGDLNSVIAICGSLLLLKNTSSRNKPTLLRPHKNMFRRLHNAYSRVWYDPEHSCFRHKAKDY